MRYALIFGLLLCAIPASLFAACTASVSHNGAGTRATTGNATVTATVANVGDPITGAGWCIDGSTTCTLTSATVGTQTATKIATAILNGASSTGVGYLFYIPASTQSGSLTVTLVFSTHTEAQVWYMDWGIGSCTAALHVTSSLGTSSASPMIVPAITAAAGDFVYIFCDTNSSFSAMGTPYTIGTIGASSDNMDGYIASASGSSQPNNATNGGGANAGLAISFTMTGAAGGCSGYRTLMGAGC